MVDPVLEKHVASSYFKFALFEFYSRNYSLPYKTWPENTWNMAIFLDDSLPRGWDIPAEIGFLGVEKTVFFPGLFDCMPLSSGTKWSICILYVCTCSWVSPSYQLPFFCKLVVFTVSMAHKRSSHCPTQTWQLRKSPFKVWSCSCFYAPNAWWISRRAMVDTGGYQPIIPFIFLYSYFIISPLCHYVLKWYPASVLHPMKIA